METIADFVTRTGGPLVPFVSAWYPWAYAHHYLRGETSHLPAELGEVASNLSVDEARDLIEVWSGLTGEPMEDAARLLADAYLRRWGLQPTVPPTPDADDGAPAVPAATRPPRPVKTDPKQRRRRTPTATAVQTGVTEAGTALT